MRKAFAICLITLILGLQGYAQKVLFSSYPAGALPWVHGDLPANSNQINYKVVQGDGEQLPLAQGNAIKNLLFDIGAEKGVTVTSKTILEAEEKILNNNSSFNSSFSNQVNIVQDGFTVSFYKVDEYYEKLKESNGTIIYRCWQLYALGAITSNRIKQLEYSSNYGMNAGFRSILIPGWGQLYKKEKKKGFLFMGIEAVAIGNIIFAQSRYNYNNNRAAETPTMDVREEYNKRAEDCLLYRNISIGVAATTLIWSVIDAVATDGAPRYASINKGFQLQLTSNTEVPMALGICYKY